MPPTSSIRKTSLATNPTTSTMTQYNADTNSLSTGPRRSTSGRTIRTNTTRPANYYARPFGSLSSTHNLDGNHEANDNSPPGFYPALQFFSDAITALPKEVMRQFTLMKEVEAKIHGPNESLGELVDTLMELPVPTRQGGSGPHGQHATLMSLTANNSTMGSASASLVNGIAGRQLSAQQSVAGSVNGEDGGMHQPDGDAEMARRKQYHELRMLAHGLLPNLDEKNVVLAEANRVLSLQLARVDSVLPYVETEISEESRLGSMTHWAYSDNRQKKVAPAPAANRRDVAATNSLAAAADLVHEREIAMARRDAGREATRDKQKGRAKEHVDSDFDDKPRKTQSKLGKGKAALQGAAVTGLGISTGSEPVKRRKVDKGLAAPGMERTFSGATKGAKAQRETPRSTPAMDSTVGKIKKTKAAALPPKKRMPTSSAQASPNLGSSPLLSNFSPSTAKDAPAMSRTQSARLRQNSSATNLRHERTVDDDDDSSIQVPVSTTVKSIGSNGERKANGKRKAPIDDKAEVTEERAGDEKKKAAEKEVEDTLKHEDLEMPDAADASRSGSNSGKAGRASKTGTPRTENFPTELPSMARTRSTRSMRAVSMRESSSAEPAVQGARVSKAAAHAAASGGHRRVASNSHLVKQLAPFNRSPDLDRHLGDDDDDDEAGVDGDGDLEMEERRERRRLRREAAVGADQRMNDEEAEGGVDGERQVRRPSLRKPTSRPVSRRNTQSAVPGNSTPATPTLASQPRRDAGEEADEEGEKPSQEERDAEEENFINSTAPEEDFEQEEAHDERPDAVAASEPAPPESLSPPEPEPVPDLEPEPATTPIGDDEEEEEVEVEDEEEEEDEEDEDDPDDPKYCYCNRGSYGEMVACDNNKCAIEWFHLGCTELKEAPGEEEVWFCKACRPTVGGGRRRGGGGGGGRGGRGR